MSPVVIIFMFSPSAASAANILPATPVRVRMPVPTTDTLLTSASDPRLAPNSAASGPTSSSARASSPLGTVKPMAARPAVPTLWAIMSTTMFRSAIAAKTR